MPSSVVWGQSTVGRHIEACAKHTDADRAYFREHRYWPRTRKPGRPRGTSGQPKKPRLPVYRGPEF